MKGCSTVCRTTRAGTKALSLFTNLPKSSSNLSETVIDVLVVHGCFGFHALRQGVSTIIRRRARMEKTLKMKQ